MRVLLVLPCVVFATVLATTANVERQCACKVKKLYLDLVLVIDASKGMTQDGLAQVQANAATWLGMSTVSQTEKQALRVSLISYDKKVKIWGDLLAYQDMDSMMSALYSIPLNDNESADIEGALKAASQVFDTSHKRENAKTVVMLYASSYNTGGFKDPLQAAMLLKESGHAIITVAFAQSAGGSDVEKIGQLASEGYAFKNRGSTSLIQQIQGSLCKVNCWCKSGWKQYAVKDVSGKTLYGECIRMSDLSASWFAARMACPSMAQGAFLAQEFSHDKHNFIVKYATKTDPAGAAAPSYHIGLHYVDADRAYMWLDAANRELPMQKDDLKYWAAGFPYINLGKCVGTFPQTGTKVAWQNENCYASALRYPCQVSACDTDNYCDTAEDK